MLLAIQLFTGTKKPFLPWKYQNKWSITYKDKNATLLKTQFDDLKELDPKIFENNIVLYELSIY